MFNLFLIFQKLFFPFLKISNEEVYSNNKDKVATMMAALTKLSYAVSHYASHHLRANMKFSGIEIIIQSMKTDSSIIYMVTDHQEKS